MLKVVVPKILGDDFQYKFIVFEGKQDLEKRLLLKLRGWRTPNSCFIVMRDQDSENCLDVKKRMQEIINKTGKSDVAIIRIACRELESFYLGDLEAVEKGLQIPGLKKKYQNKAKYRHPDYLNNAAEELQKLTKGLYYKVSGSRNIAPYMNLENNQSYSFRILVNGILKIKEKCS